MLRNRRERGEGQFGCLVGLVVMLIAGLIAYRMIPVKVKAAELRDTVIDESKSAGQHNNKIIRRQILAKAEQLELPIEDENIEITRKAAEITIDVTYTVPVEFPGYTYDWDFHVHTENPIF
jgi:predicted membrane protein